MAGIIRLDDSTPDTDAVMGVFRRLSEERDVDEEARSASRPHPGSVRSPSANCAPTFRYGDLHVPSANRQYRPPQEYNNAIRSPSQQGRIPIVQSPPIRQMPVLYAEGDQFNRRSSSAVRLFGQAGAAEEPKRDLRSVQYAPARFLPREVVEQHASARSTPQAQQQTNARSSGGAPWPFADAMPFSPSPHMATDREETVALQNKQWAQSRVHSVPMAPLEGDSRPNNRGSPYNLVRSPNEADAVGRYPTRPASVSRVTGQPFDRQVHILPQRVGTTAECLLAELCGLLSACRGMPPPDIPSHVVEAFVCCVARGGYFVKYSPTGSPHERFLAIRVLGSQLYGRQPYIEWSTHDAACTAKGRLHLSTLTSITDGTDRPAFRRFLLANGNISGPIVSAFEPRLELPSRYAFTLQFHTPKLEELNLLVLDGGIFNAWTSVLMYFVTNQPRACISPA